MTDLAEDSGCFFPIIAFCMPSWGFWTPEDTEEEECAREKLEGERDDPLCLTFWGDGAVDSVVDPETEHTAGSERMLDQSEVMLCVRLSKTYCDKISKMPTRRPLIEGGDVSAIYTGTRRDTEPIPKPAIARPAMIIPILPLAAVYTHQSCISISFLRPLP